MQDREMHQFITTFFTEMDCPILTNNESYIVVQLTNEIDEQIMNRPYYWQYIRSTGETPSPAQLTFIIDSENINWKIKGEPMHIGAPRFQQIVNVIKRKGAYVRLYEQAKQGERLTPWLNINYKVSYRCHQRKEHLYSVGMNLMTGEVLQHFYESIATRPFAEAEDTSPNCLPPIIQPVNAASRLSELLEQSIRLEDHQWAYEALQKMEKEKLVLRYFFEHMDVKPEQYYIEKEALEAQYTPSIDVEVVNGGVFYLDAYPSLQS